MDTDDAVWLLRKHNAEIDDEPDGFLSDLRPYQGIRNSHFTEVVKALYFAAPLLNSHGVDPRLVHTVWDLTRCARLWTAGPHEPMFHGNRFISDDEKRTLDRWIYEIETMTLYLLRGFDAWEITSGLVDELVRYHTLDDTAWLVDPFLKSLEFHFGREEESFDGDDVRQLCLALMMIGTPALGAIPLLERVAKGSKYPEARCAAEEAIAEIRRELERE